ncbi:MAG: cysteine desulfurase NifS [Candidatus Omnitrophota bacterium]
MKTVYLDSNATTRVHPAVLEEMIPFYTEKWGNASSMHAVGRAAKKALERSRERVAELLDAPSPEEIIFTSGGTESNNFAIKSTAYTFLNKGNHIITSSVEHHAVLKTCEYLKKQGFTVTRLSVNRYGEIDPKELRKCINKNTILITIMAANNETGTIMPVKEIGKIASENGVLFHTDAVQMAGKMPFSVRETGADMVSLSGHKLYGPKGIGALYLRKKLKSDAYHHGGSQERGRRAGTENIPCIVGFGKACELARINMRENYEKTKRLRDLLYSRILKEVKYVTLNGHPEKRLPNTLNLSFQYLEGESIILSLDLEGICVSSGSACTSGSLEVSHVLKNMGLEAMELQGSVRFSLSIFNTEEEIESVMEKLPPVIERLRKISPVYVEDKREGRISGQ